MTRNMMILIGGLLFGTSVMYGYNWSTNPGDGSPDNPYQISEPNQLIESDPNLYSPVFLDNCFILMNDIDLSGYVFTTAVIAPDTSTQYGYQGTPFTGIFNGNNHSILNLTIESFDTNSDFVGLFGYVSSGGQIYELGVENVNITGVDYVGGLCGLMDSGFIGQSYVNGAVSGDKQIGGLCGYNNHGTVSQCYVTGAVSGSECIGGLCGENNYQGSITNCYSTGVVSGDKRVGGLCGENFYGIISQSYAAGAVNSDDHKYSGGLVGYNYYSGNISFSYFLNTAGPDNGYGQPLTDNQMKQQASFIGWDFVDDGSDGPNNIWRMCADGIHYPKLSWEFSQNGDFACPYGIGIEDLLALAFNCLTVDSDPNFNYACDGSGDGVINLEEMGILSRNW